MQHKINKGQIMKTLLALTTIALCTTVYACPACHKRSYKDNNCMQIDNKVYLAGKAGSNRRLHGRYPNEQKNEKCGYEPFAPRMIR
jgi:hypothetical protein